MSFGDELHRDRYTHPHTLFTLTLSKSKGCAQLYLYTIDTRSIQDIQAKTMKWSVQISLRLIIMITKHSYSRIKKKSLGKYSN